MISNRSTYVLFDVQTSFFVKSNHVCQNISLTNGFSNDVLTSFRNNIYKSNYGKTFITCPDDIFVCRKNNGFRVILNEKSNDRSLG